MFNRILVYLSLAAALPLSLSGSRAGSDSLLLDPGNLTSRENLQVDPEILTVQDSLDIEMLETRFSSNLDSLVNIWYIENSLAEPLDTAWQDLPDSALLNIPDSVYIDRFERLPFKVDLAFNRYVKNYIRVYTGKRKELMEILLGTSEYYFPMFEEVFDQYGIPYELKYCSIVESALNPRAVSPAGATGTWQFMYGTGRMYGLTINSLVDERRDPFKATHAAARYMKDLHDIYGNWTLVIAAYNCGPGNVNRAIHRSGGKRDFWDIYYFLPRETRGHVPAFIAATYIMNYYREHNLIPRPLGLPMPVDTIMISENLHLEQVSGVLDVSLKMLRDINPQYKFDIIPGREKPYALRIPQEHSMRFIELEDSIYAFRDSTYFGRDRITRSPSWYTSNYVPEPPSANMTRLDYTIRSGDNLGYIASWYHVGVSDLKYWNNLYGNTIRAGRKLIVYVPKSKLETYRKINSMSFTEKQRTIGKEVLVEESLVTTHKEGVDYEYYTVKSGDTLWEIAQKYPGVTDSDLIELNQMEDGSRISPGMVIRIKPKAAL